MERFVDFISGVYGQRLRLVVGALLVATAMLLTNQTWQWVLAIVGTLLALSGILRVCLCNLLVGRPLGATPEQK